VFNEGPEVVVNGLEEELRLGSITEHWGADSSKFNIPWNINGR